MAIPLRLCFFAAAERHSPENIPTREYNRAIQGYTNDDLRKACIRINPSIINFIHRR